MQRVLTVSLNRNAYQFEADAHERLVRYLDDAAHRLQGNPDHVEILRDLEQAVADRCRERMHRDQSVITLTELDPALAAIGEVEDTPAPASSPASDHPALQQISEKAYISGVCAGLAHSAKIELTVVRVIALVLLFFTQGAVIVLYIALMLLIPYAPLDPHRPPLRKLPRRCRETVIAVRAKLKSIAG